MHEVRLYHNSRDSALWWTENDLGFTGAADQLPDLLGLIREWAEAEEVAHEL